MKRVIPFKLTACSICDPDQETFWVLFNEKEDLVGQYPQHKIDPSIVSWMGQNPKSNLWGVFDVKVGWLIWPRPI